MGCQPCLLTWVLSVLLFLTNSGIYFTSLIINRNSLLYDHRLVGQIAWMFIKIANYRDELAGSLHCKTAFKFERN